MRQGHESIDWDEDRNCIVVTKQEQINVKDATGMKDVGEKLKQRLSEIVQQVKRLKTEADRLKSLLDKLDKKAGPIGPAVK